MNFTTCHLNHHPKHKGGYTDKRFSLLCLMLMMSVCLDVLV